LQRVNLGSINHWWTHIHTHTFSLSFVLLLQVFSSYNNTIFIRKIKTFFCSISIKFQLNFMAVLHLFPRIREFVSGNFRSYSLQGIIDPSSWIRDWPLQGLGEHRLRFYKYVTWTHPPALDPMKERAALRLHLVLHAKNG